MGYNNRNILYSQSPERVKSRKCFVEEESSKICLSVQMILDYEAIQIYSRLFEAIPDTDSFAQSRKARFFEMGGGPNNSLMMHGFA